VGEACCCGAERACAGASATKRSRSSTAPQCRHAKPVRPRGHTRSDLVRPSIDLLVEQLQGGDAEMFALGLGLVRQMPAAGIAAAAAGQLPTSPVRDRSA